jgi:hypothetical protein
MFRLAVSDGCNHSNGKAMEEVQFESEGRSWDNLAVCRSSNLLFPTKTRTNYLCYPWSRTWDDI